MITSMPCPRPGLKKGGCILPRLPRCWCQRHELLVLEGHRPTIPTGEGMTGYFLPQVPKRRVPFQDERETLDSLLMLVTDEMDP